jgi:hypothetical protein
MMTRQHFVVIANMLGHLGRGMTDEEWGTTLEIALIHLKDQNGNYQRGRFIDHARDVRNGVRDINGDRVTS